MAKYQWIENGGLASTIMAAKQYQWQYLWQLALANAILAWQKAGIEIIENETVALKIVNERKK
jgi:hypothetical protein